MQGAGWGPPGFTSILWREEVQVPRFLPLNTDGTSKIVGERYGKARGEQTGPLHGPPIPQSPHAPLEKIRCHTEPVPTGRKSRCQRDRVRSVISPVFPTGPARPSLPTTLSSSPPPPPRQHRSQS